MVPLIPADGSWEGTEGGIDFVLRSLDSVVDGTALLENSRYQLLVRVPSALRDAEVRVGGLPFQVWKEGNLLVGQIDVGHTFGLLSIEVHHGGRVLAGASIEVRPRHLNPDIDFPQIKADLDRISFSLLYAIWRRAHQQAFPDFSVPQGTPEWLAMLRNAWARIKGALRQIGRDPNTEILLIHEVRRADRAGHLDAQSLRWLARRPDAWTSSVVPLSVAGLQMGGRYITPERALATRREITVNTPVNRALKHALSRFESRLIRILEAVDSLPPRHFAAADRAEYVNQLREILRDSQHHTVHGFLRDVELRSVTPSDNLHVVRADPRYRQVFRSLGVLQWGVLVDVSGPITEMSLKDTWELYEFWVYLFVLGLFESWGWACLAQGAFSAPQPGAPILLDLARGDRSKSQFERIDPATGRYSLATVTFHREFPSRRANPGLGRGALTVTRNVDVLLEVETAGEMRRIVLDPKYRAEVVDGHLMCPPGAIDDMHVYRDAIGRWEVGAAGARHFVRALNAAVAVFPSHDELGAKASIFYESLADGIGALPLLPTESLDPQLLPEFLQDFVN